MKKRILLFLSFCILSSFSFIAPVEAADPPQKVRAYYREGYPSYAVYCDVWIVSHDDTSIKVSSDWTDCPWNAITGGIVKRDYTWYGPTSDSATWNAGLEGWEVPLGNHVVYPTAKSKYKSTRGISDIRFLLRDSEWVGGTTHRIDYGTKTGVAYSELGINYTTATNELEDKLLPTAGNTVASVQDSDELTVRAKNLEKWTRTYNDDGIDFSVYKTEEYRADEYFFVRKYVVTVTGTGGGGGGAACKLRTSQKKEGALKMLTLFQIPWPKRPNNPDEIFKPKPQANPASQITPTSSKFPLLTLICTLIKSILATLKLPQISLVAVLWFLISSIKLTSQNWLKSIICILLRIPTIFCTKIKGPDPKARTQTKKQRWSKWAIARAPPVKV